MTDRAELANYLNSAADVFDAAIGLNIKFDASAFPSKLRQAATALSAEGGAGDVKIIQLGEGDWIINHGYLGEDAALFIEPSPARGTVGAEARDSGLNKTSVAPGGIVIAISNLAAAEVLSGELQKTIKRIGTRRGMGPLPLSMET